VKTIVGVAESSYECQLYTYPKVSLSLGFKNSIKEDSYPKSATPYSKLRKLRDGERNIARLIVTLHEIPHPSFLCPWWDFFGRIWHRRVFKSEIVFARLRVKSQIIARRDIIVWIIFVPRWLSRHFFSSR